MLILGTANFGSKYGIFNDKLSKLDEIINILQTATLHGFSMLDLSPTYGNSFQLLESSGFRFNSILKIPSSFLHDDLKLRNLMDAYNFFDIETLMLHDIFAVDQLKKDNIYEKLNNLAKKNAIKKLGISLYSPKDAYLITKEFKFDVIQIPVNVFDQRILSKKYLDHFNKLGIEIHMRSIFLQGLLLRSPENLGKDFFKWSKLFSRWDDWCNKKKVSKQHACIKFIDNIKCNKKIIIGVKTAEEILNFYEFFNSKLLIDSEEFKEFSTSDEELINPRKWTN